jgi:bacteriocin-like protein
MLRELNQKELRKIVGGSIYAIKTTPKPFPPSSPTNPRPRPLEPLV